MKETLILRNNPFTNLWYLRDCNDFVLGSFKSIDEAKEFAKDNGYRLQIIDLDNHIEWYS